MGMAYLGEGDAFVEQALQSIAIHATNRLTRLGRFVCIAPRERAVTTPTLAALHPALLQRLLLGGVEVALDFHPPHRELGHLALRLRPRGLDATVEARKLQLQD